MVFATELLFKCVQWQNTILYFSNFIGGFFKIGLNYQLVWQVQLGDNPAAQGIASYWAGTSVKYIFYNSRHPSGNFLLSVLPSTFLPKSPTLSQTPLGLFCSWANSTLAYTWATHMVRWAEHTTFPAIRISLEPLLGLYSKTIVHCYLCWQRGALGDVIVHMVNITQAHGAI